MTTDPLPPTLDTAAMLFEKYLPGWTWTRVWVTCPYSREWFAFKNAEFQFKVPDTGDELHDRLALFYAALAAKEKT